MLVKIVKVTGILVPLPDGRGNTSVVILDTLIVSGLTNCKVSNEVFRSNGCGSIIFYTNKLCNLRANYEC